MMTTDTLGGVWTFTSELTLGLLELGHEVSLLSLGHTPTPEQLQWARDVAHRNPSRFRHASSLAPLEWMSTNALCWKQGVAALRHCLRTFDADILHSNQFVFGRPCCGLPTLISAHSDILSWAEACQPEGLAPSPWLATALKLTRDGLAGAETIVAPTHWVADTMSRLYGKRYKPTVIHNGRHLTVPDAPRELQAVTVGRLWDPAKGLDLLATLDPPLPILIAGETHHAGIAAPSLPDHITTLGPLPPQRLAELFASSSLYIAASSYEPFGLAPLEAALCGCAILARDIPSLREVWGDAALYFTDALSFQQLLHKLVDTPTLLAAAQARSLARARRYTRAAMTQAYLAAYDQLLLRHATPPYAHATEHAHAV